METLSENVRDAQRGDRAALDRLWRRTRRYAATVVLAHRPRRAELEDLLQDVAARVVEKIDQLRDPDAYLGWLRQICVRVCQRAAPTRRIESLDGREVPSHRPTEDERVTGVDGATAAIDLIDGLIPDQREVLILRALAGWNQRKIADSLGIPETTVESRLARARRALRERCATGDAASALTMKKQGGHDHVE